MAPAPDGDPTIADVTRYLDITGWSLEHLDDVDVFYPPDDSDLQIVLPSNPIESTLVTTQIADAVRVIAYASDRTEREVRANLAGIGADTIAVRLQSETPSGTAPLAAAQQAITALRDLVVGAASALRNDSLTLPARPPIDVDDYADRTRLSTRPGSFIVDLTLPLTTQDVSGQVDGAEQDDGDEQALIPVDDIDSTPQRDLNPYGRAVSRRIRQTVSRALVAAEQVATGDLTLNAFTEPRRGLGNATELEAIAKLGGDLGTTFQVRFAESALAPGAQPVDVLSASPAQQQVLSDAAALIRDKQSFDDIRLSGYVIRLVKRRHDPHAPGDVTFRTVVEELGETINCWVHLAGSDYESALNAHQEGLEVDVTGDLMFTRGRWWLRDASNFNVPALDRADPPD